MEDKEIIDSILQLSNNCPIIKEIFAEIGECSIIGRLYKYKTSVLEKIIEQVENRPSTDDDWRQIVITAHQGGDASMTSKEEIYYKQMHVGTLSFRMEKFTAFFDFTPA